MLWNYLSTVINLISTISDGEYVLLLASLEAKLDDKFHCGKCITQYGNSDRLVQKTIKKRISKGCFSTTSKNYRLDNIRYNTCIGNFVIPIDYYVEAFRLYEKGILPFDGTLGEQPNKIIEIFQLIEVRKNEKMKQGS